MFEEIDSGKEKRRKRLSDKRYERMSSGRRHAKRRRPVRRNVYEDVGHCAGDILMNGRVRREEKNEKKFREEQDGETEEQEEDDDKDKDQEG